MNDRRATGGQPVAGQRGQLQRRGALLPSYYRSVPLPGSHELASVSDHSFILSELAQSLLDIEAIVFPSLGSTPEAGGPRETYVELR